MNEIQTQTQSKLKSWPSPQDYNEAVQDLQTNCDDPQLRGGFVEVNQLGIPRPLSGAFASVYRVKSHAHDLAVRCFLRDIRDQEHRYALISDFIQNDSLPYTVTFDFLPKGIRVNGRWHPVLKMEWLDGLNLDLYVEKHRQEPAKIAALAESFKRMCAELQDAGIAHGDLQHGNILVCNDELRLVDYDGMFVPSMAGLHANEIGHRNYQHPRRNATNFGPYLDNFSAWVIYASLRALTLDPKLFETLGACDDCLLFRRDDFLEPEYSFAFATLEHHENAEIVALSQFIRWQCRQPIANVPPLGDTTPVVQHPLPPIVVEQERAHSTPVAPTARPPLRPPPRPAAQATTKLKPQFQNIPRVPIEAELQQSTPRICVWANSGALEPHTAQWLMLLNPFVWVMFIALSSPSTIMLSVACLLVNIFTEVYIWKKPRRDEKLVRFGEAAKTRSLMTWKQQDVEGMESYYVGFQFSTAAYRLVDIKRRVSFADYERINAFNGAPQTVLFDPLDPHNVELYCLCAYRAFVPPALPPSIEPELGFPAPRKIEYYSETNLDPLLMTLLFACFPTTWAIFFSGPAQWLFAFGTAAILLAIWHRPMIEADLIRNGVPAEGKVTDIIRADPTSNSTQRTRVEVQFFTDFGQKITASHEIGEFESRNLNQGSKLTMLYDSLQPDRNLIYKFARYRAK